MPFSEHRRLIQTLLLSVSAHAVLLLGVVRAYPPELGVPAMTMNVMIDQKKRPDPIRSVAAAPGEPGEGTQLAMAPRPEPRKAASISPKRVVRRAESAPSRIAVREASPVIATAVSVPAPVASTDASLPGPVHLPSPAPAAVSVPGEAPSAREGVHGDDLRQYRVSLASAARRYKRYPALAREQGWVGTVEVALRFHASLAAPDVLLVRSSGRPLLDEQALAMLEQAARATDVPPGLRGRDFQIPLPVQFSLDDVQ